MSTNVRRTAGLVGLVSVLLLLVTRAALPVDFLRGDANGDGRVTI